MDRPRCGALVEPLSGRRCEPDDVEAGVAARAWELRELGLEPGDRVLLRSGNSIEFFVDLLAVWWLGACAVPVDPRLTPFELDVLARAARPRLSLGADAPAVVAGRAPVQPPQGALTLDGDALVLFTSGTTGDPKGVVHTHRSLRAQWTSLAHVHGRRPFRRTLCLLPTHFGHGLICNSLFPWLGGADLHVLPPFRPDVVSSLGEIVDEHAITFLSSVPSLWRLALRVARPPAGGSLEQVFCGSAPLSAALWEQIAGWSGARVLDAYGITETASWVAGTSVAGVAPEDGLVGVPWGADLAIMADAAAAPGAGEAGAPGAEGLVWLRTPALMRGYLDRPDLTAAVVSQGWFSTGDVGAVDERGLLFLRGRLREEINKGGLKVYPGDVDGVVEQFPGVTDACAFAVDDPLLGQDVAVAVVFDGPQDGTLAALRAWLPERLARHQLPVRWYVLDEIPRTSRGKVNRGQIAELCARRDPAGRP